MTTSDDKRRRTNHAVDGIERKALSAEEAAAYIGRPGAVKTMANWRSMGKGPRWISVLGRPTYLISDLDSYLNGGGDAAFDSVRGHSETTTAAAVGGDRS